MPAAMGPGVRVVHFHPEGWIGWHDFSDPEFNVIPGPAEGSVWTVGDMNEMKGWTFADGSHPILITLVEWPHNTWWTAEAFRPIDQIDDLAELIKEKVRSPDVRKEHEKWLAPVYESTNSGSGRTFIPGSHA